MPEQLDLDLDRYFINRMGCDCGECDLCHDKALLEEIKEDEAVEKMLLKRINK